MVSLEQIATQKETQVFTIDEDNNILAATAAVAPENAQVFETEADLQALACGPTWPMKRLADIWNSFAGIAPFSDLKPVLKFENREKAVRRIFGAIQRLPKPDMAKAAPESDNTADREAEMPKATAAVRKRASRRNEPTQRPAAAARGKRREEGSTKREQAIAMLRRKNGALLTEIMEAFSWQAHTVRGFIATLGTKHRLAVESFKRDNQRAYRIPN